MFTHYLKIALRHLHKHRGYAFLNVVGLSLGIAACLVIFVFVREELSYDRFHERLDRIYRVYSAESRPDGMRYGGNMPMPQGPAMEAEFPTIEHAVRIEDGGATVEVGDRRFNQSMQFVDAAFFQVFSFPLLRGDARTALAEQNGVVLTEATARKFFGDADPMGKTVTLHLNPVEAFVVTGVAADPPQASTVYFNMLVRFEKSPQYARSGQSWNDWNHQLFVQVAPGTDVPALERSLAGFARKYHGEYVTYLNEHFGTRAGEDVFRLGLQPLRDVHLDTRIREGRTGSPIFLAVMIVVAAMLLGSGCINFVNLALGQAAARVREVGVRKVVGAGRRQLVVQFWSETAVLCGVALLIGVGLAQLLLPAFNTFMRRELTLGLLSDWTTLPALVALLGLTVALAASYPSLYLARFRPVEILKGQPQMRGPGLFRSGLLVFQFTLSILFIICTLVMSQQLGYLRRLDPGFDQEQVVTIPVAREDGDRLLALYKSRVAGVPGVVAVSGASNRLGVGPSGGTHRSVNTFNHLDTEIAAHLLRIDPDYLKTFGIELAEGRAFEPGAAGDVPYVLVNETLARRIKTQPVVGSPFTGFELEGREPVVLGVVKDFHFESMHRAVEPLVLHVDPATTIRYVFVRITPDAVPATLAALERGWEAVAPETPFTYTFVDEDVDRQYRAEERQIQVATTAGGLTILIACLGLFGLSVMAVNRRLKEIGIRKVLGATAPGLVMLVAREFVVLVGVAFVVAAPLGYFAMNGWLEQFAFRVGQSPLSFAAAGLAALGIALATVGYHALRAALANPVKALRYE